MTVIILILTSLLFQNEPVAPKGAKQIIISNSRAGIDNFKYVKGQLADRGVEITNQDQDIFQIKTGFIEGKKGIMNYYLIRCKENTISISGFYISPVDGTVGAIENVGMKGSLAKITFESMLSFSYSLDKGDFSFN